MGINRKLRIIEEEFDELKRQDGIDFLNNMANEFEATRREVKDVLERNEIIHGKKQKALDKLNRLKLKYNAKASKKSIFVALDEIIAKDNITDEFYISKLLKRTTIYDKESVRLALRGYCDSKQEIAYNSREKEEQEKFNTYWWEVFYLICRGILLNLPHLELITRIICKEFGTEDPDLTDEYTFENWLKNAYSNFSQDSVYWGYNFYDDPNAKWVKQRINELRSYHIDVTNDAEYLRELNKDYLLGIADYILENGSEFADYQKKEILDKPQENQETIVETEKEIGNKRDSKTKQTTNDNISEKKTKEKKKAYYTPSPLQQLSEKIRNKTNSITDSMSNSLESITKKISDTTESLTSQDSMEDMKKKVKKGLKGWLNKISEKLDD